MDDSLNTKNIAFLGGYVPYPLRTHRSEKRGNDAGESKQSKETESK